VDAIALSVVFSLVTPEHERRAAAILGGVEDEADEQSPSPDQNLQSASG